MSYRVMQHCFGARGSGGPIVALERFLASTHSRYGVLIQEGPAGGVNARLIRNFIGEIRKFSPDLIHVRGLGNEAFHAAIAARIAGVPNILVSVHGTQRDLVYSGGLRSRIVSHLLEPLTLKMATHVATVCEYAAKREFLQPYQSKLVGVVPNGVPVPAHIDRESSRGVLIQRLCLPDDVVLAVCVSRITPEKGYLILADALARLDGAYKNLVVLIVGGGDEDGLIRKKFEQLNCVRTIFLGHVENVSEILSGCDFFIFPSLHENLSNALLEAMAHRLPVVASDAGGNAEVLRDGAGILVPTGQVEPLADAIGAVVVRKDLRIAMASASYEVAAARYSVEAMVEGWEALYKRILGEEQ